MKTSLLLLAVATAAVAQAPPAVWYQLDYFKTQPAAAKTAQVYHVWFTGTKSDYSWVTVTTFSDYRQIEKSPKPNTVKTDILGQLALTGTIQAPWLSVNFIKSNRGMEADRQNDEIRFWKPIHDTQLRTGRRDYAGWFAAFVRWPSGAGVEYDIVSADAYTAFGPPEEGGLEAEVAEANRNTALHGVTVRRELWERIGRSQ